MRSTFRIFFTLLDQNKDMAICDSDMFENMKLTESTMGQELLSDDLAIVSRAMNKVRDSLGKGDDL